MKINLCKKDKNENDRNRIRNIVNTIYDMQKLRISVSNRLVATMYLQKNEEEVNEEEKQKENDKKINIILKAFNRINEYCEENKLSVKQVFKRKELEIFDSENPIQSKNDYKMVKQFISLKKDEEEYIRILEGYLKEIPIYSEYLVNVKGCGTLMSGVIVAYFDIYKANTPSSFNKYCGTDTVFNEETGKREGRSMKHTVMVDYEAKDGSIKQKKSITYNPFLKCKLVEVLCGSFLKTKSPYAEIFYSARDYYKNNPAHEGKSDLQIMRMASRKMLREFLRELWFNWRVLEGLPICKPYEEAILGINPNVYNPSVSHVEKQSLLADYFEKRKKLYEELTEEEIEKNGFDYYDLNLIKSYTNLSEDFLKKYSKNLGLPFKE